MTTTRKSGIRSWLPLGYVVALVVLVPFAMGLFDRTQSSEGSRSGVIVKLSYKGRLNKSWEGELMLGGVQSGRTWTFSLDPSDPKTDALAAQLNAAVDAATPVTLRYHQRFIGPWSTDTNYLVFDESIRSPGSQPPSAH